MITAVKILIKAAAEMSIEWRASYPLKFILMFKEEIGMNDDILGFIARRFPITESDNDHWMTTNCYYFARILKSRFKGELWYDLVDGHFLFKRGDYFFDWSGIRTQYDLDKPETVDNLVRWSDYKKIDPTHYDRICRDVIW